MFASTVAWPLTSDQDDHSLDIGNIATQESKVCAFVRNVSVLNGMIWHIGNCVREWVETRTNSIVDKWKTMVYNVCLPVNVVSITFDGIDNLSASGQEMS